VVVQLARQAGLLVLGSVQLSVYKLCDQGGHLNYELWYGITGKFILIRQLEVVLETEIGMGNAAWEWEEKWRNKRDTAGHLDKNTNGTCASTSPRVACR